MKANAISDYSNILSVLKSGDAGKFRKVITNYDSLLDRIQFKISVKTIDRHLEKAHNSYINKDSLGEKKALLLALNEMISNEITDENLSDESLKDYRRDVPLSISLIENRLYELGWSG